MKVYIAMHGLNYGEDWVLGVAATQEGAEAIVDGYVENNTQNVQPWTEDPTCMWVSPVGDCATKVRKYVSGLYYVLAQDVQGV